MEQGNLSVLLDTARQRWELLAAGAREFHKRALTAQTLDLAELDKWPEDTQAAIEQYVYVLEKAHTQCALSQSKAVNGRTHGVSFPP
jgi:hypothetical protein